MSDVFDKPLLWSGLALVSALRARMVGAVPAGRYTAA